MPGQPEPGAEFGSTLAVLSLTRRPAAGPRGRGARRDTADSRVMVVESGPGVFAPDETAHVDAPRRRRARARAARRPDPARAHRRRLTQEGRRSPSWALPAPGRRRRLAPPPKEPRRAGRRPGAPAAPDDVEAAAPPRGRGAARGAARSSSARAHAAPKVTILLVHAWGMGGTIRTMLTVAGRLAERHEVEVVSLWRTREEPFFAFPPGVTVTRRRRPPAGAGGRLARAAPPGARLAPVPRRPHEPADDAVDRRPARAALWRGALRRRHRHAAGAQPARRAVGGAPARVATEHTRPARYNALLRREIRRRYGALDAVVVLCEAERAPLEGSPAAGAGVRDPERGAALPGGPRGSTRPVVVAAGRLVRAKGFDRLIQAFAVVAEAHPGWRLRICGDGPRGGRCARRSPSWGSRSAWCSPGACATWRPSSRRPRSSRSARASKGCRWRCSRRWRRACRSSASTAPPGRAR